MTHSAWLWLHLGLLVGAMVGLVLAASAAVIYLFQSHQLKSKHLGKAFRKLPSLSVLDTLHFRSLSWGVALFSMGILTGVFWAKSLEAWDELLRDRIVTLSVFTCLFFWIIFSVRLKEWRRGQKIAAGTVLAFALLVITLLSVVYGPSFFHGGL